MSAVTKRLSGNIATIFNGGGFLAKHVVAKFGKSGAQIVLAHRGSIYESEKLRVTAGLGQMYFASYNLKDEKSLYEAMKHSNIVVNTIGKENETRNFSWNEVHVEGPRRMARIARECGVEKFIHISALNARPDPEPIILKKGSQFYKSKYHGELAVREEFPDAIIFRPADIMGESDNFLVHFTNLQRCLFSPRLPLYDYYHEVEKQPVYVSDLAKGIENACSDDSANGKTFQAVGPYRYDFCELIEYMRSCGGQGREDEGIITNLRYSLGMRLAIFITNALQKRPFLTWERIERDSTSDYIDPNLPTLVDLGVELTPLELHIQTIGHWRPRMHRVEITYDSARRIDLPRKLNVAS